MSKKLKAAIVGLIIAAVVGFAASQGWISQQTAEEIKTKANETLSEDPAPSPQPVPPPAQQPEATEPGSPPEAPPAEPRQP
jgi:hypothetical protein